jgi:hypothetical protein
MDLFSFTSLFRLSSITDNTFTGLDCMSSTALVLYETGTVYPSRAHWFIGFWWCPFGIWSHLCSFLCCIFCFVVSFCVLCPMLPVSLDSLFLIVSLVFFNIHSVAAIELLFVCLFGF